MGREARKARGNPWYEARMRAAEWDPRLASREGAAELLGMSVSAVADAELGLSKVMPVDKAVLMADQYRDPNLLNTYCLEECPIGRTLPLTAEVPSIERVTLSIIKQLRLDQVERVQKRLVEIAEDGEISAEEMQDLKEIADYFEDLQLTLCRLRNLTRAVLSGGRSDG